MPSGHNFLTAIMSLNAIPKNEKSYHEFFQIYSMQALKMPSFVKMKLSRNINITL